MATQISSAVKKQKASKVFGGEVFEEADSSLGYSPSPMNTMKQKNNVVSTASSTEEPVPTVLFGAPKTKQVSFDLPAEEGLKENSENASSLIQNRTATPGKPPQRSDELNRLRAQLRGKSPNRRDMVKKTQAAINTATTSVNDSLNVTRKAKENMLKDKSLQTKKVRFQWKEEVAEAKSFHTVKEMNRRKILQMQRDLSSQHFKSKAQKDQTEKMKRIAEAEKNTQFNSEVFRDHQQKLKAEQAAKRKKSIDTRAKIRRNNREGEEKMKSKELEEQQAIFDVRYDLHKAQQEAKERNAKARRESFKFRVGDGKRIRELRSQWKADELQQQHESYELKRAADRDVDNYKKQMQEERRKSLHGRGKEAQRKRNEEQEQAARALDQEHMSYELKWAGEKDAEAYERKMAEDRRKSLAARGQESHRQRNEAQDRAAKALEQEHASYELKWAGEKDAEAYEQQMREERRKSLAARNKESARHAQVMSELRSIAQEQESESYMLKWAGENDAKEYLKKMQEERRKSLQQRGEHSKEVRQWEEDQHNQRVNEAIQDGILQSECQKDVENYKKESAEKRRKSLQYRGKEKTVQRVEAEVKKMEAMKKDHESHILNSLAQKDVEQYIKDCQKRRRKSLAWRAKEKRRHFAWKRQQQEREVEAQNRSTWYRTLDAQHQELAKQKELAREALSALRSAGCNVKGNPFEQLFTDS